MSLKLKKLSDSIVRVNNGIHNNYSFVILPYSKECFLFFSYLFRIGYVRNLVKKGDFILIFLKYRKNSSILKKILSNKLTTWNYWKLKKLIKNRKMKKFHLEYFVLHTSLGYMTLDRAYNLNLGGELVCELVV